MAAVGRAIKRPEAKEGKVKTKKEKALERTHGGVEPWVQVNPDGGMGATMTRLGGSTLSLPDDLSDHDQFDGDDPSEHGGPIDNGIGPKFKIDSGMKVFNKVSKLGLQDGSPK